MLPVILMLILIAVLFGAGLAIHALWWVALVALVLFVIGYAMHRGGHGRRMLHL
jgi:hypothetical protein